MVVGHDIFFCHGIQRAPVRYRGAAGSQTTAVFIIQPTGPVHVGEDLHVGHQLTGLSFAQTELLQLAALAAQMEDKLLVGKDPELLFHVINGFAHISGIGKD